MGRGEQRGEASDWRWAHCFRRVGDYQPVLLSLAASDACNGIGPGIYQVEVRIFLTGRCASKVRWHTETDSLRVYHQNVVLSERETAEFGMNSTSRGLWPAETGMVVDFWIVYERTYRRQFDEAA